MLLALAVSYAIGSFPTGCLLVKWFTRQDVRTIGSGNVGATNVARAAGLGLGAAVFLIDLAKGVIAVLIVAPAVAHPPTLTVRLSCGLAAVVGHNFPVFLKFRGGKGVATTIGVLLAAMPAIGIAYLVIWGLCVALWRYVSVGSLIAAISIPIAQGIAHQAPSAIGIGALLALLIAARHHANIARLLRGTEHRVTKSRR